MVGSAAPKNRIPLLAGSTQRIELGLPHERLTTTLVREESQRISVLVANTVPGGKTYSGNFSPLTVNFADLQMHSDGYGADVESSFFWAHLLLVFHSFVMDHEADGQMVVDRVDRLVSNRLLVEGLTMLEDATGGDARVRDAIRAVYREHASANAARYIVAEDPDRSPIPDERVFDVASGRAALGFAATHALALHRGLADDTILQMRRAYDCLVVGLQWCDDLDDWREDLHTGDENLLLIRLRERRLDAYAHPDNDLRHANVGHALVAHGLVDHALAQATVLYSEALAIQESLGCVALADLIRKRIEALVPIRDNVLSLIDEDIMAQLARSSGDDGLK